tara:strand:+ start:1831 stop:2601 length:771 start_codon:yes stop_codon:yes gene_type:complete
MKYTLKKIDNNIGTITINRPEVLNAMSADLIQELIELFNELILDETVGVIIITGAGDKSFIAGADIKAMQKMDQEDALGFGKSGQRLTKIIENSSKPVIAAVNGFALGGGCEISLACHIRIASDNAMFAQPEVSLGILPGWGGTQRLPRIIGYGLANEMITTGKMINSNEAYRIGLVNHVVTPSDLLKKCEEVASEILKNGPNAIAQSLKCIKDSIGLDLEKGLEIEVNRFSELFDTKETKEGLSAFVEKRKPNFR